jgi:hypothetical protein
MLPYAHLDQLNSSPGASSRAVGVLQDKKMKRGRRRANGGGQNDDGVVI